MAWDIVDFAVFGGLVGGAAVAYKIATMGSNKASFRAAAAIALLGAFLLVWVTGAVGIIGSENNDANLMYGGVLLIGLLGALLARFRPEGMSRTMVAVAAAQILVLVITLAGNLGVDGAAWPMDVLVATAVFTAIWLSSAWMFRRSAREPISAG